MWYIFYTPSAHQDLGWMRSYFNSLSSSWRLNLGYCMSMLILRQAQAFETYTDWGLHCLGFVLTSPSEWDEGGPLVWRKADSTQVYVDAGITNKWRLRIRCLEYLHWYSTPYSASPRTVMVKWDCVMDSSFHAPQYQYDTPFFYDVSFLGFGDNDHKAEPTYECRIQ